MKFFNAIKLPFMSTPADPEASSALLYFKSDGLLYKKVGSTEAPVGSSFVNQPAQWIDSVTYSSGDLVGMAGKIYRARNTSLNKPPIMFTSNWSPIHGTGVTDWSQKDQNFIADTLTESWDVGWRVGTSTCSLTSTAGEFETGKQAFKAVMAASSYQRIFEREENFTYDGEVITTRVRAKLVSAAAGATIDVALAQNDQSGSPVPLASGLVIVGSNEGLKTLTTTWTTYEFTTVSAAGKPRAMVEVLLGTTTAAANIVIDSVRIIRGTSTSAVKAAGLVAPDTAGQSTANNTWTMFNRWSQDITYPSTMRVTANGFQASESGYYDITFEGIWASNATGTRALMVDIAPTETEGLNLTRPFLQQYIPNSPGGTVISLSGSVYIPAGYWVRAWSMQNSGGALVFGNNTGVTLFRAVKQDAGQSNGLTSYIPDYGSAYQGTTTIISTNPTTPVTLYTINIPHAGTWDISYWARCQPTTLYSYGAFALYDGAGTKVANTELLGCFSNTPGTGGSGGGSTATGRVVVTTTGAATYTVRGWSGGAYNVEWYTNADGRTGATWTQLIGATTPSIVQPAMAVIVSNQQAIPAGTWTLFTTYNGNHIDPQGGMIYSGGWMIVPSSGLYQVNVSLNFLGNTTRRILAVSINTVGNIAFQQELGDAVAQSMSTGGLVKLAAGDKVGMGVFCVTAQNTYPAAGLNAGMLQVVKVSD